MSESRGPSSAGIFTVIGVGFLAVLCCAGPVLLAGGALSGLGGVLRSPWLITVGVVLMVGSLVYTVVRRVERRNADDSCCPSPVRPTPGPDNRPSQKHDPASNDRVEKRTR